MLLTETNASKLARAANDIAAVAAVGYLDGIDVALYQTLLPVSPSTPLVDLDAAEATYSGYAREAVTWGVPSIADGGEVEVIGTVGEFRPTSSAITNVIWGLYLVSGAGTALYFLGQFDDAPLPMGATTDSLLVTLRYRPASSSLVVVIS